MIFNVTRLLRLIGTKPRLNCQTQNVNVRYETGNGYAERMAISDAIAFKEKRSTLIAIEHKHTLYNLYNLKCVSKWASEYGFMG